jgi:restriction system protein
MAEQTIWGIHGGRTGDADTLFLKGNVIAIGWGAVGDLSKLGTSREAFKEAVAKAWPEKKAGAVPNNAGQLFRFVHVMKPGDIVAYPSKSDRQIHLGRVDGQYLHDPQLSAGYPNQRSVSWIKHVSRSVLSQGSLYELGATMSLFQVKNYADEILALLEGTPHIACREAWDLGPPPSLTRLHWCLRQGGAFSFCDSQEKARVCTRQRSPPRR